jgi:protein-S-isoprenylcysteine O-methyltransferase Ste14
VDGTGAKDVGAEDIGPSDDIWSRGGAWVLAQFPLTALALLAAGIGPRLPQIVAGPARWLGAGLLVSGAALFVAGALAMGSKLTPFPKPNEDTALIRSGAFGLARHPIYGGGVIAVIGWALFNGTWLGLVAAGLLAVFFDAKSRLEERWLSARFPEYGGYRRRVRRLIPFVY